MEAQAQPIVLIGAPGSGKTSVGREAAALLGWSFIDLDELLAQQMGDLGELVLNRGDEALAEAAFQSLPSHLHSETVIAANSTVAGERYGTSLEGATVVYLKADLATIFRRSGMSTPMPMALVGTRAVFKTMLDERDPHYQALADHTIDVNQRNIAECAREVVGLTDHQA